MTQPELDKFMADLEADLIAEGVAVDEAAEVAFWSLLWARLRA